MAIRSALAVVSVIHSVVAGFIGSLNDPVPAVCVEMATAHAHSIPADFKRPTAIAFLAELRLHNPIAAVADQRTIGRANSVLTIRLAVVTLLESLCLELPIAATARRALLNRAVYTWTVWAFAPHPFVREALDGAAVAIEHIPVITVLTS